MRGAERSEVQVLRWRSHLYGIIPILPMTPGASPFASHFSGCSHSAFPVTPGASYYIRLINAATQAYLTVSVDVLV